MEGTPTKVAGIWHCFVEGLPTLIDSLKNEILKGDSVFKSMNAVLTILKFESGYMCLLFWEGKVTVQMVDDGTLMIKFLR